MSWHLTCQFMLVLINMKAREISLFYKMSNCGNSSDLDYLIYDSDSDSEFSHLSYDGSEVEETVVQAKETKSG